MPLIFLAPAVSGAAGLVAGFFIGDGVDGLSRGVKWAVVGGGLYLVAKVTGVIK